MTVVEIKEKISRKQEQGRWVSVFFTHTKIFLKNMIKGCKLSLS